MKTISPVDSSKVIKKYKNGQLREAGKEYVFETEDYLYTSLVGENLSYFKSGALSRKTIFDDLGIQLSDIYYDEDGQILQENLTQKLDTSVKTAEEFFDDTNFDITTYAKFYSFSVKFCRYYLKKEGACFNYKKTGVWKIYNPDGSLKKEKSY
ncbi:hypothetical protein SCB49_11974 [unidentified eubacterium SCB49]|nr:hypothetical protein SCB49_11974 [unidentified eubacterium SCB49]